MKDCVFCKIARHVTPSKIIHEDDDFIVFHDKAPSAPVHLLIIPRRHLLWKDDLKASEAFLGRIFSLAPKMAEKAGVKRSGYKLVMNCGAGVGQIVDHFHVHLMGGWEKGK